MMVINKITFDFISPIWRDYLWPGRLTKINPTNGLELMGGYNRKIETYTPTFIAAFLDGKCVGVNSGHATSETDYRSRGMYVFPEYRKQGISRKLLEVIEDQAKIENKTILWSMPRESAVIAYEKFGFKIVSDFFDDMEFGPNCYVVKLLE